MGNGTWIQVLSPEDCCDAFHKKRGLFPPLDLSLGRNHIREVSETRFLGMILDSKLTWIPHLKYVKHKSLRSLNLLKCISKKSWGADRRSLLQIYRATVRSQLDYGCQIYASATAPSLKMLNSIHHLCIRICTGAFRTSPIPSLYAESGLSLDYRRDLLSLQMYTRILALPASPTCFLLEWLIIFTESTTSHNFRIQS